MTREEEDKENPALAMARRLNGDDREPVDETAPDPFAADRLDESESEDPQEGFTISLGDDEDDESPSHST